MIGADDEMGGARADAGSVTRRPAAEAVAGEAANEDEPRGADRLFAGDEAKNEGGYATVVGGGGGAERPSRFPNEATMLGVGREVDAAVLDASTTSSR